MKKNIFICMTGAMELGGVEKSLIGLLDSFDYDKYEVDLFLYGHHGPLLKNINPNVNVLPEINELAYLRESFKTKLSHKAWYSAYRRVFDGIKHIENDYSWAKVLKHCAPEFKKSYDLAIGFFLPFDMIRDYVDAKVKLGWIHTDYTKHKGSLDYLKKSYSGIDYQVAVSEACKESFVSLLPEYKDTTLVIENILPEQLIEKQADEFDASKEIKRNNSISLLSIGRYSYAKNFDSIPEICKELVESGLDVKWHIVGFGSNEAIIKEQIEKNGMQDNVIMLGKKENPYPYIKACDVYVQPSRYEGKCVAVREAQMLLKPVIITNYPTSSSQLENGVDGVIVPMDNKLCAKGIADVIRDKALMNKLSQNCSKRDYSNKSEIEKIYNLTEER